MSVPTYSNACIAPSASGTSVFLIGVSAASEGSLQVNLINLSNINAPTATFLNQSSFFVWNSAAPKACFAYPGNAGDSNSPVVMQQFGVNSYFTNIYPNGTIDFPTNFPSMGYVSPKLFSFTGAVGTLNWYTAVANASSTVTNSPWVGVRLNATEGVDSTRDFDISTFPTTSALLSVGTYVASSNTPAQGYHVVFDTQGAGVIYTTLDSAAPLATSLDRVLTLSSPTPVDMGGITLTNSAFSMTMGNVGYILDKASDGSTLLYSITPGTSAKLQRVSIPGNVPTFSSILTASPLGSKIITFGSASSGASAFYSFDTVTNAWSGPALVKPNIPSTPSGGNTGGNGSSGGSSSKTPIGAIVGGVVGGLVVIALLAFFVIRHRKKSAKTAQPTAAPAAYQDPSKMHNPAATPLMNQNYVLQQQQLAHNQMVQPQPYHEQPYLQPYQQQVPASQQQPSAYGIQPQHQQDPYPFQTQPLSPAQHQSPPVIFQAQTSEPYTYTPPTLVPAAEPVSPNIFQPQASEPSPSLTYNQSSYVGATSSVHSPMSPASQAYTPTSSHIPSNPQYTPAQGDSYAS